jgi:hypothetical protein
VDEQRPVITPPEMKISNARLIKFDRKTPVLLSRASTDVCTIEWPNQRQLEIRSSDIMYRFRTPGAEEKSNLLHLVLNDKKNILIEFDSDSFYQDIVKDDKQRLEWTEKWKNRRMSSFEYLLRLNLYFGRSFLNPCCYPIMPALETDLAQCKIPGAATDLQFLHKVCPFSDLSDEESPSTSESLWIPEFYFDSGVLPLQKVMQNRQSLETLQNLHEWINTVFPSLQPHPIRRAFTDRPLSIACHSTLSSSETNIGIFKPSTLLAITENQMIELLLSGQVLSIKAILPAIEQFQLSTCWNNKIVLAEPNSPHLVVIDLDTGERRKTMIDNESISALCSSDDYLIVVLRNAKILVYDNNWKSRTFLTYVGAMKCASYNSGLGLIAIGTKYGHVVLFSLLKSQFVNCFCLEHKRIIKIELTKSWGFIIVVAVEEAMEKIWLCSYSLSGELIQSCECPSELVAISSLTSANGFDRVIVADRQGFVYLVDPAAPSVELPVFRSDGQIVDVGFHEQSDVVSVVSRSGVVYYLRLD